MTFHFKHKSHDFYVSENLPYKLAGKGDAFYVYIEKRNMTTYEVIDHLRARCGLSRMSIGIAGLKDKKAVAKQRISIYNKALKQAGGEVAFIETLSEVVKVLDTGRHPFPMNMSTPITNSFQIKLRSTKKLGQEEKVAALTIVQGLLKQGYANLFGSQRFGLDGRNVTQGREIMTGTSKEKFEKSEAVFKLQAYASKVFNEYAEKRAKNKKVLDGDIVARRADKELQYGIYKAATKTVKSCVVKNKDNTDFFFYPKARGEEILYDAEKMVVTGPVPGYNLPLPIPQSVVGQQESAFLEKNDLRPKTMKKYQDYAVYGLRRPMWVYPTQTSARYVGDDMLIDFTLPSGSYASIVVDRLMEKVG